jgi:hypothetical protein
MDYRSDLRVFISHHSDVLRILHPGDMAERTCGQLDLPSLRYSVHDHAPEGMVSNQRLLAKISDRKAYTSC